MPEETRTTKERVLDQCDAMLAYVANRGIIKDVPQDGVLDLLDLPRDEQLSQPMSALVRLHRTLSRMVEPALPETIEAMHTWRYKNPGTFFWRLWRRLAPLNSVALLLAITLAITVATVALFSFNGDIKQVLLYYNGPCTDVSVMSERIDQAVATFASENNIPADKVNATKLADDCAATHNRLVLWFYVYFGVLGAFGAAYAAIYDSFNYIREGRYDLRLGSTYYVRIFLGIFSGILLAEPLAGYLAESALSAGLLAFIGGFSAQLVYRLLTKLVDSVENMFRPDRQRERYSIHEKAAVNAREAMLEDDAAKRADLAKIVKESHAITDPAVKAETLEKAVIDLLTGKANPVEVKLPPAPVGLSLTARAERAAQFVELAKVLAPALPDSAVMPAADTLQATGMTLKSAMAAPDKTAELKAALGKAQKGDPVTALTIQAQKWLMALGDRDTEIVLAQSAIVAAHRFSTAQISRWRRLAYGAFGDTPLTLIQDLKPEDLAALPKDDPFADLLRTQLTTGPKVEAATRALKEGDIEMLFAVLKSGFADRAAFDHDLGGFVDRVCAIRVADDLQSVVAPRLRGPYDAGAMLAALGSVAGSRDLAAGLQQLELIGGSLAELSDPATAEAALVDLTAGFKMPEGA